MGAKLNRYRVPFHAAVAAVECYRVVYPSLKGVNEHTMTPEAAAFIFTAIRRLKIGSALTVGFFSLYKPVPPASVLGLTVQVAKAIIAAVTPLTSDDLKWNLITYNFVLAPHTRNLDRHFSDPDTYPCPGYELDF